MTSQENTGDMDNIPLSSDSDTGNQSSVDKENIKNITYSTGSMSLDTDSAVDDDEEKQRLISQVLELQNTLDDLSSRVDTVKVENLKLKSENQVLGQYIENLMAASSVFQSATPKAKKSKRLMCMFTECIPVTNVCHYTGGDQSNFEELSSSGDE